MLQIILIIWITIYVIVSLFLFHEFRISKYSSKNPINWSSKAHLNVRSIAIAMIVVLVVFGPLAIEFENMGIKEFLVKRSSGHGGDWLQFWATYIGIIFSGLLAIYLASREAKNNSRQAQRKHITNLYLDDLREMSQALIKFGFNGFPDAILMAVTEFTREDVIAIRELFFIQIGKVITQRGIPDILRIAKTMPVEKSEEFLEKTNKLNLDIKALGSFTPDKFRSTDELESNPNGGQLEKIETNNCIKVMWRLNRSYNDLIDLLDKEVAEYNSINI